MEWKIVKTEKDLPKNGQLVLIYTNCSGQRQYYKPCKWDDEGFLGKSVMEGVYNFFAWCTVEPPIEIK